MRNLLSKVTLNWTDVQSGKENRYAPVLEIFRCLASLQSIACLTPSLCRSLRYTSSMFHIYMTWNFVTYCPTILLRCRMPNGWTSSTSPLSSPTTPVHPTSSITRRMSSPSRCSMSVLAIGCFVCEV